MTDLKTDAEKAEDVKRWWKENGTSVILGVALAIGSVFGWQQWQAHKLKQTEQASALFAKQLKQSDTQSLSQLKSGFSGSPYAALAALAAAKNAALQDKATDAIAELNWVIKHADDKLLSQVARLRLIRLAIQSKDYTTASEHLDHSFEPAYAALLAELKGDLHLAKDQTTEAAQAYRQAISLSGGNPPQYLQMKLDTLGDTNQPHPGSNKGA